MRAFLSFSEYLSLRDAEAPAGPDHGQDRVEGRSLFRGLYKAVNPARPISPTNSRLLSLPGQKRIKGQVMGR